MGKYFDILAFLMGKAAGGGGGDVTVESKFIAANGTYTAPTGKAYSPVVVSVPNSYGAGDEGKVVSNGALVAQTAHAEVTSNGTIDTTLNNSVVVNVPGGSSWTLLASEEFTVSTSSTTETDVGQVELPGSNYGPEDIIWVHIRDKAGKRNDYWYGNDSIIINYQRSTNPASMNAVAMVATYGLGKGDSATATTSKYGVYPTRMTQAATDHAITIKVRFRTSDGTIDGTYKVDVYKLTPASGMTIYGTGS